MHRLYGRSRWLPVLHAYHNSEQNRNSHLAVQAWLRAVGAIDIDGPRTERLDAVRFCPMTRQCSRTGCSEHAAVTLTYHYARAQVWLDGLAHERDPHAYDLCGRHATRLTAPRGWQILDRRVPAHADLIAV